MEWMWIRIAGSEKTSATSTEGNLCLVPGDTVKVVNRLGVPVDVVVTISWR